MTSPQQIQELINKEPDGYYPLPPGYQVPNVTTWDTPWFLKANLSVIPPPPGVLPNFSNPVSRVIYNHITLGICLPLATLFVMIRVYTKTVLLKNPGWEDRCCVAGLAGLIINSGILLTQDYYGAGTHLYDVKGSDFIKWTKCIYVNEIIYGPIVFTIKLAILLLYLRVFQPIRGTFVALHVILWANALAHVVGTFTEVFQCSPIRKIWYRKFPGSCIDQKGLQIGSASINIVSDLSILILPIWSVRDLQTGRNKKLGLFTIFGLGFLGVTASCARLGYVLQYDWTFDVTWNLYPLNLLATAEMTCGLVCGCLPMLPAFFRHMPRIHVSVALRPARGTRSNNYRHNSNGARGNKLGGSQNQRGNVPSLTSPDSSNYNGLDRKKAWEELDDLEYQGGDWVKKSEEDVFDYLPIQKQGT